MNKQIGGNKEKKRYYKIFECKMMFTEILAND